MVASLPFPALAAGLLGLTFATAATAAGGLAPGDPFRPGKLDFHFDRNDAGERANLFWWSPVVKVGAGVLDTDAATTRYAGGFARGGIGAHVELIAGGGLVDRDGARDAELQAEVRLPRGFGLGGGGVRGDAFPDVGFGKLAHRGRAGAWHTVAVLQLQEYDGETSAGGMAGLYEERFFLVAGTDGEQRQVTAAALAPARDGSAWRPVLEAIWIDQDEGDVPGPEILFVNGTLGFRGGFLSNPARLGRAMGPTGVEFANPLGFLWSGGPWNRRLDPWELGGLGDLRMLRVERPNGTTSTVWEALVFPLQLAERRGPLDGIFVGATLRTATGARDDPAPLAGYFGKVGFLQVAASVEVGLETEETRAVFGLVDPF